GTLAQRCVPGLFSVLAVTIEVCTLSLHVALPIYRRGQDAHGDRPGRCADARALGQAGAVSGRPRGAGEPGSECLQGTPAGGGAGDRKSTRLNSSHLKSSYAVFCLKTKTSQAAPAS